MDINAFKMDGLGNDFIIIDRRKNPISINKEKIIELGRRDNIGFDQLIFIDQINNDAKDHNPITIFNSDGLEVEACGNGSRCVAKILCDEQKKDEIKIITSNRILKAKKISDNDIKLEMGVPVFEWKKIPLSKDVDHKNINLKINHMELKEGFAVNVGNPHVVFFVKDCFKYDLKISFTSSIVSSCAGCAIYLKFFINIQFVTTVMKLVILLLRVLYSDQNSE